MGYTVESFWDQTNRTLSLAFRAHQIIATREHNERMQLAWHVAALQRSKKLPRLKTLLAKVAEHKTQSWQEQMAVMDMWAAHTRNVERRRQKLKTRANRSNASK